MLAVTLVKLPNTPVFLGSFDIASGDWWYSNPLPGSIDEIIDATWAYGQYHVCFAKMLDNTYSIFQSNDYGVNWVQVLNLPYTIHTIFRVDYGRLLCSTSNGIYQSTNSGSTWTKISTKANLVTIREVGNEKLVAVDSSGKCLYSNTGVTWTSASSNSHKDCIDGQNGIVLNTEDHGTEGVYLGYSQDYGHSYFTGYPSGHYWGNNTVVYWNSNNSSRLYELGYINGYRNDGDITKIICTGMNTNGFPTFVIQQKLYDTNILRHYYARMVVPSKTPQYAYYYFTAKFDAIDSVATDLSAKEILQVGTSSFSRTVVFSGMYSDGTPRIRTSADGGYTWVEQNVADATIYSGPDLSQAIDAGGAFLDDSYISTAWTGPVCHNSGSWFSDGYVQMGISYSVDFLARSYTAYNETYTMDVMNAKLQSVHAYFDYLAKKQRNHGLIFDVLVRNLGFYTYTMDVLNQNQNTKTYAPDILNKKQVEEFLSMDIRNKEIHTKAYSMRPYILKTEEETHAFDMVSVLRGFAPITMQAYILKEVEKPLITDVLCKDTEEETYLMNLVIQDTIVYKILSHSERYSPQFPAIGINFKKLPYPIFDSREETKE